VRESKRGRGIRRSGKGDRERGGGAEGEKREGWGYRNNGVGRVVSKSEGEGVSCVGEVGVGGDKEIKVGEEDE